MVSLHTSTEVYISDLARSLLLTLLPSVLQQSEHLGTGRRALDYLSDSVTETDAGLT